jgi:uncharacterized membrane protein
MTHAIERPSVKDPTGEVIASLASKATYSGGATAVVGGLTANEIAAFVGAAVAVLGLLVQIYFKARSDRREAEFHRARLAELAEHVEL